ncbi:hypothetical protein [Lacrimispora amygdalina]|uniref:hypothetical protein n=1 Tax=Lacrimispora amygdalina TaxID=253257 RepID=UPI000BE45748|nr:hypothetical protein [Lacrimispora amygdalina]
MQEIKSNLTEFISEILSDVEVNERERYFFELMRWNSKNPYWCIFAHRYEKKRTTSIGGHYCLSNNESNDLTGTLNKLVASGFDCKITKEYFYGED